MADQLGCGQHRNAAVNQRFNIEVSEFVGVDWTAYTSFSCGSKDVADLSVGYRKYPLIRSNPVSRDIVPKLYPQPGG